MIYFLGLIAFFILIFLSGIHFYWAAGGKWGFEAALPTDEKGNRKLNPKWFDSVIVGMVLGFVAILVVAKLKIIVLSFLSNWILNYGLYVVSVVFFLRSIGDFNYVGFFKKIINTQFAENDTKCFSPLCLFLGAVGVLIEFFY